MKAIYVKEYGGRDKLISGELPDPQPQEGEVLVRIKAAGVNPVDWKIRAGYLKSRMPNVLPIILGWDVAGVVEERGLGARRFQAGDRVYAYCRKNTIHDGTYAEYIALPECYLASMPEGLNFMKAAAVPLTALTAYQGLIDKAALKKGETCLIVGASGGVGSFAVQFARLAGARVIAVGSRKNHAYLRSLGARHTIDYARDDVLSALRAIVPSGADVVFDLIGGESLRRSYDCVRKGGRVLTIVEPGDQAAAARRGFKLIYHFVEPNAPQLELFSRWFDQGRLKVNVSKVFPLEEAAKAHELIEGGHTRGKIVLKVA